LLAISKNSSFVKFNPWTFSYKFKNSGLIVDNKFNNSSSEVELLFKLDFEYVSALLKKSAYFGWLLTTFTYSVSK
jgi:hypothetical protein